VGKGKRLPSEGRRYKFKGEEKRTEPTRKVGHYNCEEKRDSSLWRK
jgi:hypothetical protein